MDAVKEKIAFRIKELYPEISQDMSLMFETPADKRMGDIALPCFRFAKVLRKAPAAIASALAETLGNIDGVERCEAVNGYLNFFVSQSCTLDMLRNIRCAGTDYGRSDKGRGKRMIIDYSSPNIAKRFHIGHLGTTVIGNSIKKIHAFCGYDCVGINYLGDWGTQYGKLVVAYKMWGDAERIERDGIEELERLYVQFGKELEADPSLQDRARDEFAKLEKGDEENMRLWKLFKDISLRRYMQTYELLGIEFESYDGESFYRDKMQPVIDELERSGLSKVDNGATIVDLSEYNMPPLMVLKSDGATSYATRDLAAAIYRYETYKFDKSLYVTSAGQSLHFAQLFKVLELMGYKWADRLMHVPYGTFSINGEKIASRTGNVVLIDDLFADAIEKAKKVIDQKNPLHENKEETAKAVGLGAIIFNTLLSGRIRDVNFNWEGALSFEGNTGPYVQYTYARCCSVLAKSGSAGFEVPDSAELAEEEIALVNVLAQFPSRVEAALEQCEPSVITRYSLDVCSAFNSFYNNSRIIGSEGTTRELRLALTAATRDVLGNALDLIGLKKMSVI